MNTRAQNPEVRQERDVLPWRSILLIAIAVIIILALLTLWATSLLSGRNAALRRSGTFPEPNQRVAAGEQQLFQQRNAGHEGRGQALNRRKSEELSRFGWADKDRELVRLPIEDAMRLLVEENQR